ncbi:MAG: hypothetical protein IPK12_19870 [Gemmatimonadetes bacterium]|nr:hypothetical protein [Gemmatimonadota bacterium]
MSWLRPMGILILAPWLALVPAVLLAVIGKVRGRRLALWVAAGWVGYMLYELGMKYRLLCGGECNIRVDLLVIYPLLLGMTAVALFQAMLPATAEP